MKNRIIRTLSCLFLLAVGSMQASASNPMAGFDWEAFNEFLRKSTYNYEVDNPIADGFHYNDRAGSIENIFSSYNTAVQHLNWEYTIEQNCPENHGFWLVISPGEDPKQDVNEYAIFYGDAKSGKVTSYVYNGEDGPGSYQVSGSYIQSDTLNVVTTGNKLTASMSINTSAINNFHTNPEWSGAQYSNKIGIWFHPLYNADFTYNVDGSINTLSYEKDGWYDISNADAHNPGGPAPVPEPSTYAMLALGLLGLGYYRKRVK